MQFDSLLRGEILLFHLELRRQIEQPHLLLLLRDHFIEKGKMVAEKDNARGVIDLCVLADVALKKDSRHRRNVLVAETQIGLSKASVPRLYSRYTHVTLLVLHVPCKNLFRYGHRAIARFN